MSLQGSPEEIGQPRSSSPMSVDLNDVDEDELTFTTPPQLLPMTEMPAIAHAMQPPDSEHVVSDETLCGSINRLLSEILHPVQLVSPHALVPVTANVETLGFVDQSLKTPTLMDTNVPKVMDSEPIVALQPDVSVVVTAPLTGIFPPPVDSRVMEVTPVVHTEKPDISPVPPTMGQVEPPPGPAYTAPTELPPSEVDKANLLRLKYALVVIPAAREGQRKNWTLPEGDFWARRVPMPSPLDMAARRHLTNGTIKDWTYYSEAYEKAYAYIADVCPGIRRFFAIYTARLFTKKVEEQMKLRREKKYDAPRISYDVRDIPSMSFVVDRHHRDPFLKLNLLSDIKPLPDFMGPSEWFFESIGYTEMEYRHSPIETSLGLGKTAYPIETTKSILVMFNKSSLEYYNFSIFSPSPETLAEILANMINATCLRDNQFVLGDAKAMPADSERGFASVAASLPFVTPADHFMLGVSVTKVNKFTTTSQMRGRMYSWFRVQWQDPLAFAWQCYFITALRLTPGSTALPVLSARDNRLIKCFQYLCRANTVLPPPVLACLLDIIESCPDAHARVLWDPYMPDMPETTRSTLLASVAPEPRGFHHGDRNASHVVYWFQPKVVFEFAIPPFTPTMAAMLEKDLYDEARELFELPVWTTGSPPPLEWTINPYLKEFFLKFHLLDSPPQAVLGARAVYTLAPSTSQNTAVTLQSVIFRGEVPPISPSQTGHSEQASLPSHSIVFDFERPPSPVRTHDTDMFASSPPSRTPRPSSSPAPVSIWAPGEAPKDIYDVLPRQLQQRGPSFPPLGRGVPLANPPESGGLQSRPAARVNAVSRPPSLDQVEKPSLSVTVSRSPTVPSSSSSPPQPKQAQKPNADSLRVVTSGKGTTEIRKETQTKKKNVKSLRRLFEHDSSDDSSSSDSPPRAVTKRKPNTYIGAGGHEYSHGRSDSDSDQPAKRLKSAAAPATKPKAAPKAKHSTPAAKKPTKAPVSKDKPATSKKHPLTGPSSKGGAL